MSPPHLETGSQQPPKFDGKVRLYSMEYCPYAQRNRLVLIAKNIPHEIVNINLKKKPEWYTNVTPQGKVPALDTGSEIIIESLVISDFLDEKYPNPPLYPKDPTAKKQDQELFKKVDCVTSAFTCCIFGNDRKSPEDWAKDYVGALDDLDKVLAARGTTFFGGDKPGMVDYMLWPWCERKQVVSRRIGQRLPVGDDQLVVMRKWYQAMLEDPVVKATLIDIEKHWKITHAYVNGLPVDIDSL